MFLTSRLPVPRARRYDLQMAPPRALLLDLGNVVIEIDFIRMLTNLGLRPEATERGAMEQLDRMPVFDAFERGAVTEQAFFSSVSSLLTRPLSFAEFEKRWNTIFTGEVPGIGALLKKAKRKLPLYALTNANSIHMRRVNEYPAMAHFDRVFTSYDLKCRKPEPEIYRRVCSELALRPEEILFLDDREENVAGAAAAGLASAVVFRSSEAVAGHLRDRGVVL
jgi:glucose-1-phosphatase